MYLNSLLLLVVTGVVLQESVLEARSVDSSQSIEIILNILLGRRNTRQGEGAGGNGEITGNAEERIRSALETLQQHIESLSVNISALERINGTLQRIQDMAEDTNTVQQSILDYLGLEDEITTGRPIQTETPSGACSSDQIRCDNDNCITGSYQCDGDNDCGDGSDENESACPHLYTEPPTSPSPPSVYTEKEEIYLTEYNSSYRLQHPAHGGQYLPNERIQWIFRNEDPTAVGFRIDTESVFIELCCDYIAVRREDCHFDTLIKSYNDGPIFLPGPVLNLTFVSDGSVNYDGFTFEVSAIYSLDGIICPYDTATGRPTLTDTPRRETDPPTPPPVYTEEIYLNEDDSSYRLQHPAHGGPYLPNERLHWIFQNEDPTAVGFRIDTESLSIEHCCDYIVIPREDCHFDTMIKSSSDDPIFVRGPVLNLTFTSDGSVNYNGFTVEVSAVYSLEEIRCPYNEQDLVLQENQTTIQIIHPKNESGYENNEDYIWKIRNENHESVGLMISYDKIDIDYCCDVLSIEGDYCSYGRYTYLKGEPVTLRGDRVNVTWKSDSHGTGSGFILGVTSLQALNKTDCYEYTCDDIGRCVRAHYDDVRSWNDSEAACRSEGARLVVITDEGMNALVDSVIDVDWTRPYIGIYGDSLDGMTWTTGSTPYDYNYYNWDPNFSADFEETRCGRFFENGWRYSGCFYGRPYVCEKLELQK